MSKPDSGMYNQVQTSIQDLFTCILPLIPYDILL